MRYQNMQTHMTAFSALTTSGLVIYPDYGYVLLAAVVLALEILVIGFIFPGGARKQYFSQEYLKKHFGEQHRRVFGTDIQKGGYPDMGCGMYASKLNYEEWYHFNNAQRAHLNFVEWAPSTLVLLFIGGIYFAIPAAYLGLGIIIARLIYSFGYKMSGPEGRIIGAIANDVLLLALFVLSIISCVYFIQGYTIPVSIQ